MEGIMSQTSYCGMLLKGLKFFSIGNFDPTASEHSVNKIQVVMHVVSWFLLSTSLFAGYFDAASFDDRVLSFAVLANMFVNISKFAMFSLNRNTLHKLIKLIDVDAVSRTKTDLFVKEAVKDIAGNIRSYGFFAIFCGVAYMGRAMLFDKLPNQPAETKPREVVHMYIPYDVIVFERIGVARSIMTIILFYLGYGQYFLDFVTVSLFTHVGWQFEATADLFGNVPYSDDHAESRVRLKEVIDYHQLILGYAEHLQTMYNGVFLVQLIGCCLPLCFSMLLFVQNLKTADGSLVDAVSHVSFLVLVSFQLFLYTRCADLIMEKALLVSNGIYLSDWHLAPPSTKKDLSWILMHGQRPIKYTAMGIFPMTIATFTQIMCSAYGEFSVMTSVE